MVACDSADEVDFLWGKLIRGGEAFLKMQKFNIAELVQAYEK